MSFERMIIDMNLKQFTIKSCQDLVVKLEIIVKNNIRVRRTLRVEKKFVIEVNIIVKLSIDLRDDSILDKDYLFEFNFSNTYAHIVDVFVWFVYVKNDFNTSLEISRHAHMNQLVEFEKQDCYQISSEDHVWAINENIKIDTFENNSQSKLINEMNVYDDFDEVVKLQSFVDEFVILWENTNKTINLSKNEWMTISLSSDWNSIHVSRIDHKIYSLDERDRLVIDKKFDKLHEKSKMQWFFKLTFFEFSIFVIWRTVSDDSNEESKKKHRVVTNIRELNKLIITNKQFILMQVDIITLMRDCEHISLMNDFVFFLQFLVVEEDKHKFSFI